MPSTTDQAERTTADAETARAIRGLSVAEYRVEGREKVTGSARFAADAHLPGMVWAAYARSPYPHARVLSVDASAALAMPGVHAVLTGADVRPARIGRRLLDWPVLAWDRVRFIGDRVAAVAADTRELAQEAASRIRIEYEELPAVFTPQEALAPGAPILHESPAEYVFLGGKPRPTMTHANIQGHARETHGVGDIEAVFQGAHRVFEHEFNAPRQHQGHIEPHATLVSIRDGVVHVVSTNKTPFNLREQMAETLSLLPAEIEVESRFIGGDFGGKGLSLDEYVCYFLAKATGRPVKAVMDYADELQAANPRHSGTIHLRTAVDADGRFLAHQTRVVFDGGAYAAGKPSPTLVPAGGFHTLGPYSVPNADLDVMSVYTNTVPAGHMRGPGETQALFAAESHVDMIAEALGMDPMAIRLLNVVRDGESSTSGVEYRAPRGVEVLETLRSSVDWGKELQTNRGRGLALTVRRPGGGMSAVALRLDGQGRIEVVTGAADQGGGSHTAIRRVAAAALSIAEGRVVVTFGTTETAPVDAGAGGSRQTYLASRAVEAAARELLPQLEALAAERLGRAVGSVHLRDDRFIIDDGGTPDEVDFSSALAGLETSPVIGVFDSKAESGEAEASFIAYAIEVLVDPETGTVELTDVTLVVDVGTIINPTAHLGQVKGGFVYGLGAAMMEELVFDQGKVVTVGLNDYKLPTSMDIPALRTVFLEPVPGSGAFGAKMVGELTNGAVGPAVANAVAAAVGVRLHDFPITSERVFEALRLKASTGS